MMGQWSQVTGRREKEFEEVPGGLSLTSKKGNNCSWQPGMKNILGQGSHVYKDLGAGEDRGARQALIEYNVIEKKR